MEATKQVFPFAESFPNQVKQVYEKNKAPPSGNPVLRFGLLILSIAVAVGVSLHPPPPKICGTLHGPSVTGPQLRLPDGRPVAYSEAGVTPRSNARYKVVVVHDYGGSRLDLFPCTREKLQELGVYMVSFDRAGYGESHPFPHRSVASEAHDIESLAEQLDLGSKFHILAIGVGAFAAWGCLQRIPHRLAGVAMVAPVANFWWPGIPSSETEKALKKLSVAERNTLRVAHYAPCLLHLWTSQNWFPSSNMERLSQSNKITDVAIQQGAHESIHKDMVVQFGRWDLSAIKFSAAAVHIWQSENDPLFPSVFRGWVKNQFQRVQYHTVPGETHSLLTLAGLPESVLSTLLGE